jgi:hydroxymethylbilane synthase
MLPAPGQAAIALEAREGDAATQALAAAIDDAPTREATLAERLLHQALGGGCRAPVGAHAVTSAGRIELRACVAALDGRRVLRASGTGERAAEVAEIVARELHAGGAEAILREARAKLGGAADEGEAG